MRERFSAKVYRTFLRLLPEAFAVTYGDDLTRVFVDRLGTARPASPHFWFVWIRAVADLCANSVRLRKKTINSSEISRMSSFPERFFSDLSFGVRSLKRTPGSTSVVLITLALGIGANTSMFSVLNSVIFRPLDYPGAERLYLVEAAWQATETRNAPHTGVDYQFLRENAGSFEEMAVVWSVRQNMISDNGAEQIEAGWTTAPFFNVFGVDPIIGRALQENDESGTGLISHALWQTSFGGDAEIVGNSITLDARPVTIVGVLPPDFAVTLPPTAGLPARIDVWRMPDRQMANGDFWAMDALAGAAFRVVARAKPGMTEEQLNTELAILAAERRETFADHAEAGFELYVSPLLEAIVGPTRSTLYALFGAVALVLLISCANVANILLVKARARRREMAVRAALGGGKGRIMSVVFAESLILALLGGTGGVAIAFWGAGLVQAIAPAGLPRVDGIQVDSTVLVFALGVAVVSTFVFGLMPALIGANANPIDAMRNSSRSVARSGGRLGTLIVGGEIAMAVVLLLGTGLLFRTVGALERVRPGFDYERLLTYSVSLPSEGYAAPSGTHGFYRDFLETSAALPGVESAAVVWPLPLEGQWWYGQYNLPATPELTTKANIRVISGGYFDVMGTVLLDGRTFFEGDVREVAVVSEALAEKEWPGQIAIGQTVHASPWGGPGRDFQVVGVVEDVRYQSLSEAEIPTIYFSTEGWSWNDWEFGVVARTSVPPLSAVPALKEALAGFDATIPLARPVPMTEYVDKQVATNRFVLRLFGIFALLAITMAGIGVYGVIAHAVGQRTREIGIRLALGAQSKAVQKLVVRQGLLIVAAGVLAGVLAAVFAVRFIGSLLYGVPGVDVLTYGTIAGLVMAVGLLATAIPTRKISLVDPAETLRAE